MYLFMRFDPAWVWGVHGVPRWVWGVHGITVGVGDSRMRACLLARLNSARFNRPLCQEPLLELLLGDTLSEMVLST